MTATKTSYLKNWKPSGKMIIIRTSATEIFKFINDPKSSIMRHICAKIKHQDRNLKYYCEDISLQLTKNKSLNYVRTQNTKFLKTKC